MTAGPDYSDPDSRFVRDVLLANRRHFVKYNITRLRELIRCVPAKKLDLFYRIPLLLHINSPQYPGYVDDPQVPHGIYGFYDSGFWTLAKRRLRIEMGHIRPFVSKNFYIKGIYLMGNAGSLGHTSQCDFHYCLVFDQDAIGRRQEILFRQKLERITRWAEETWGQGLRFFPFDAMQIRKNAFSGIDEQGLETGQKSFLKEEFYRTFILIGGQIPYWAVFPVGLGDGEYNAWIEKVSSSGGNGFSPDDYIDLGNLTAVNPQECYGALLWQFCTARVDPVNALIRTSLMVQHVLFQKEQGLLCDMVKKRFPESRLDSYSLDPYALALDSVLNLHEKLDHREGLELIRQCVYFGINGFPVPSKTTEESPKDLIVKRYIQQWSWGKNQTQRLEQYPSWPEKEKLEFEKQIVGRIWHLQKVVFQSIEGIGYQPCMRSEDLGALKNKASSWFKKKKGKLPFASVYLRMRQDGQRLYVINEPGSHRGGSWSIWDSSLKGVGKRVGPLFSAPELLRVLGWIVFNGLYKRRHFAVDFQHVGSVIARGRARRLFEEVVSCFSGQVDPHVLRYEPQWLKVFVVLDPSRSVRDGKSYVADYLVQNTWGEMFLYSQVIQHIDNKLLKHHEIAKRIWCYLQNADPNQSCYRVIDLRSVEDRTTICSINEFIANFRKTERKDTPVSWTAIGKGRGLEQGENKGLLLDLF